MTATDTEIRNTFANLRQLLVKRFSEPNSDNGWGLMCRHSVEVAELEYSEAVREHITAESLGEHS